MNKRYSISKELCFQSLNDFYNSVAEIIGIDIDDGKLRAFDGKHISVTKPIQDTIIKYYADEGRLDIYEIVSMLIVFGPKANLDGDGYEFEIEDGFII